MDFPHTLRLHRAGLSGMGLDLNLDLVHSDVAREHFDFSIGHCSEISKISRQARVSRKDILLNQQNISLHRYNAINVCSGLALACRESYQFFFLFSFSFFFDGSKGRNKCQCEQESNPDH